MKKFRRIMAAAIACVMMAAMSTTALAASIKVSTDKTYEQEGTTAQQYKYDAYKIFDASYDTLKGTWTQENKDEGKDIAYDKEKPVAYFMKTGNPWIATIQGLTDYFTVTAAADGSGYVVEATDNFDDTAAAKLVAAALKAALSDLTLEGDYAKVEITANGTAVTVAPGYYLIVGQTAANLALVTTDVEIVEKNEYPHLIKEFTDETTVGDFEAADDETSSNNDTVQIGDTISYTLTFTIPSGANQQMVVTDTFTSGLEPVLDDGKVKITLSGLAAGTTMTASAPADSKFTVTMTAADVVANQGKTVSIVYEAVVTADAWYQTEENTGKLKYGNDYNTIPDKVDSVTYWLGLFKKAESSTGDGLKGAQFELYRTDTAGHEYTKVAVELVELTDADLTAGKITKEDDTVYYRVADKNDTSTTTTIDMTDAVDAYIYGLDGDSTYYAREIKAPTGYNPLTEDIEVKMEKKNQTRNVVNNPGTLLPSTGGMGTTLFYVIGAALMIGAGVVLVARRRMDAE